VEPPAPEEDELSVGEDVPPTKTCARASSPASPPIVTMDWLALFDRLVRDFPEEDRPARPADNRHARDAICFRTGGMAYVAPSLQPKECPLEDPIIEATTSYSSFATHTYILWPRGQEVAVYETTVVSFGAGPDRPGQTVSATAARTKRLLAVLERSISETWDKKTDLPRVDKGEAKLVVIRARGGQAVTIAPLPPKTIVRLRGTSVVLDGPDTPRTKGCPTTFEIP